MKNQNKILIEKVEKSLDYSKKQMNKDRDIVQKLFKKSNTMASKNDVIKVDDRVGKDYFNIT